VGENDNAGLRAGTGLAAIAFTLVSLSSAPVQGSGTNEMAMEKGTTRKRGLAMYRSKDFSPQSI
jgi:hypothetical protein